MNQDETFIIRTFNNEIEAEMAREKLELSGIYSIIENANTSGLTPLGGTDLKVFLKDQERAEQILSEGIIK